MTTETVQANEATKTENTATQPVETKTEETKPVETKTEEKPENTAKEKEMSALKLADKSTALLPGNRPIESKHLEVVSTYGSMSSIRPVIKSGLEIKGVMTISGNRPIVASHLHISESYTVMGSRPVASNQIDDPLLLMGYLD